MRTLPQQGHCDLGLLPDQDRTEDLRLNQKNALERCANTAEGDQNSHVNEEVLEP